MIHLSLQRSLEKTNKQTKNTNSPTSVSALGVDRL